MISLFGAFAPLKKKKEKEMEVKEVLDLMFLDAEEDECVNRFYPLTVYEYKIIADLLILKSKLNEEPPKIFRYITTYGIESFGGVLFKRILVGGDVRYV